MNIYMDCSATTPCDKRVIKAMKPFFSKKFGNPNSIHGYGNEAREAIERSRKIIADFLNCSKEEIFFTSSGTESNNTIIKGVAFSKLGEKKKKIVTSTIEHPAVINVCEWLKKFGFEVVYIPVNSEGLVDLNILEKEVDKNTLIVSIMHVNNEIGTIEPIEKIARICESKGALFHTDAVQSFGKLKIDLSKIKVDFLSASGHKIYGPKGIGLIYKRKEIKIEPLLHGGGQESGIRSSTENVPGIVGFGEAVKICSERMEGDAKDIGKLRDYLISQLLKIEGIKLNGSLNNRIWNNVNVSIKNVEGESLLMMLDKKGIAVSTGSACSSKSLKASHVLKAIGLKDLEAHGSLRITLGRDNTKEQVDYVIKAIEECVKGLRKISPNFN